MTDSPEKKTDDQPHDDRPRPQYGELAPPGWTWVPPKDERVDETPREPATDARGGSLWGTRTAPGSTPPPSGRPTPGSAPGTAPASSTRYTVDRIVTIALLGLGVFYAVGSLLGIGSFVSALNQTYRNFGLAEYGNPGLASALGVVSAVGQALIVAVAIYLSIARLRSGRRAVLVPLLGIAATVLLTFVVAIIAITGDPSLAQAVSDMSTSTPTP